jgi:hypothetical protein
VKINDSQKDEMNSVEVIRRPSVGMIHFFCLSFFSVLSSCSSSILYMYTVYMEDNTVMSKQYFSLFFFSLSRTDDDDRGRVSRSSSILYFLFFFYSIYVRKEKKLLLFLSHYRTIIVQFGYYLSTCLFDQLNL